MELAIYDRNVSPARLLGANREYIERVIPHLSRLMRESVGEVLDGADVLVVGNGAEEFRRVESELRGEQVLIDLVRLFDDRLTGGSYQGICW
jgi:GDP-mannose 6-dehydrogenase